MAADDLEAGVTQTQRARELVARGETLEDAWEQVRRNSVFTIHTPVAAGNERFEADLVELAGRNKGSLFEKNVIHLFVALNNAGINRFAVPILQPGRPRHNHGLPFRGLKNVIRITVDVDEARLWK